MIANEFLKNQDFHPVLKDIENMFWFFILSNLTLMDPDVQNILKSKKEPSILPMLERYNDWTKLKVEIDYETNKFHSKSNLLEGMIFLGKAMSVLIYDYILLSSYFNEISKLEEFRFLKFIRNGAAHYNKFNMKDTEGNWKLEENESIKWSGKKIDRKLHDKKVFNDFMSVVDVFLSANFFSHKLKEIDKIS